MKNRNMTITVFITSFLFIFVLFLIYLIYCFAYYDQEQKEMLTDLFNTHKVDSIYERFYGDFSLENLRDSMNFVFDKNELKDIYFTYYNAKMDINDFMAMFYFGDVYVNSSNIDFYAEGKTSLFKRAVYHYEGIHLVNKDGYQSYLGFIDNISFEIEPNSKISLDGDILECNDNVCNLPKVFGGLHEINYVSNGFNYYGLVNLYKEGVIDITNLDSLVRVTSENAIVDVTDNKISTIKPGVYRITKCYMKSDCANKKISYIKLYNDNTCSIYTWLTIDQAGDYYEGEYKINGNFLELSFTSHIYSVFDYDTKETTRIKTDVDILLKYQILSSSSFENDSYKYVYKDSL